MNVMSVLGMLAIGALYWKWGFLNPQQSTQLADVSSLYDEVSQFKTFDAFTDSLKDLKLRQSASLFEQFDRNVRKIQERNPNSKLDTQISAESLRLKKNLTSFMSLPDPIMAQKILKNKLIQFIDFTQAKNYPSLKSAGERIREKIQDDKKLGTQDITALANTLRSEQDLMEKVVAVANLKVNEKNEILGRIRNFDVEIDALDAIAKKTTELQQNTQSYRKLTEEWVQSMGPLIASVQINLEKRNHDFAIALGSYLALLLLFALGNGKIISLLDSRSRRLTEDNIGDWLKKGLIKEDVQQFSMGSMLSKDFDSLRTYVLKRIQFSSNFQEALPFASILLDNNLRVVWANDLFCETWGIDPNEIKTQALSWDYLSRATNLGSEDPVVESFQKNIPGIYQIQLRLDEGQSRIPFEMYLSPIGDGAFRKMMIFFYPLISLEETISNQAKALITPIEKLLAVVASGQWNGQARDALGHEFNLAGMAHIFEKFSMQIETQSLERQGLLREIDVLEGQIQDYHKLSNDLVQIITVGKTETTDFRTHIQQNRESVVQLVDTTHSFDHLSSSLLNSLEQNIEQSSKLAQIGVELSCHLQNGAAIAKSINQLRQDVKRTKDLMTDAKAKLLQVIDQAIVFQARGQWEPHQLELTFNRIKTQARDFDVASSAFERQMAYFDVAYSKLKIILDDFEQAEKLTMPNSMQQSGQLSEYQMKYNEQNQNVGIIQEELVANFEDLAMRLKNIRTSWERASYLGGEAITIYDRENSTHRTVESSTSPSTTAVSSQTPSPSTTSSIRSIGEVNV